MDENILHLFADLPAQGPGADADTIAVLATLRPRIPTAAAIADFGCGTGRSSLVLLNELPAATVQAIDTVPLFIERLTFEAKRQGVGDRLRAIAGDMLASPIDPGSLDLIWSEGAAYAVGFENALRAWAPLLSDHGLCVVSECEWLSDERPPEVADFWCEHYPAMGDRVANIARSNAAGYDVLATHILSEEGWTAYYSALTRALELADTAALPAAFIQDIAREIQIRSNSRGTYGYVLYVLQAR